MNGEQVKTRGELCAGRTLADGDAALLDVNQVASLLSCSARHVYRLADAGKLPRPHKLGALVRWSRQAVLDWIDDGCPSCRRGR